MSKTIRTISTDQFRELGSKFLGFLFPCTTEEEFAEELARIKTDHPVATHHCYGWRINDERLREFSSDDGEPSGTAGLPILNTLKSNDLVNAGVVVVRYYGGTKLGKPGLIEAYSRSAENCINNARLLTIKTVHTFEISYPYPEENRMAKLKNDFGLEVLNSEYAADITLKIACEPDKKEELLKALKQTEHLGFVYADLGEELVFV